MKERFTIQYVDCYNDLYYLGIYWSLEEAVKAFEIELKKYPEKELSLVRDW